MERDLTEGVSVDELLGLKPSSGSGQWKVAAEAVAKTCGDARLPLRDFIRFQLLKFLDPSRPPWLARLVMRELTQPSEACAELVREYIEPKSKILLGILHEILPSNTPRRIPLASISDVAGTATGAAICVAKTSLSMSELSAPHS